MTMVDQHAEVEEALSSLGERLREHQTEGRELTLAIRAKLTQAQEIGYPMTRAADKIGVHRTTLYRAYL
jgi:transcriptional regulator of acetoin/glycerol metabolism